MPAGSSPALPPWARLCSVLRLGRVPGEDELPARFESRGPVQPDRCLVVWAGPHVAERHPALLEQPPRLFHQHLADSTASVLGGHVDLGHLALEPRPWVEENYPAEPDDVAGLVPNCVDDVFAREARRHRAQVALDLAPAQLGVIRV